jgi:hypothetical protein
VLAATIIVAVLGMLEMGILRTAWQYDRGDALAWARPASACWCWAWKRAW